MQTFKGKISHKILLIIYNEPGIKSGAIIRKAGKDAGFSYKCLKELKKKGLISSFRNTPRSQESFICTRRGVSKLLYDNYDQIEFGDSSIAASHLTDIAARIINGELDSVPVAIGDESLVYHPGQSGVHRSIERLLMNAREVFEKEGVRNEEMHGLFEAISELAQLSGFRSAWNE